MVPGKGIGLKPGELTSGPSPTTAKNESSLGALSAERGYGLGELGGGGASTLQKQAEDPSSMSLDAVPLPL